jgi:hypothetical protein
MQLNDAAYDSKLFNFVDLNHLSNAVGDSYRDPVTNVLTCGTVDNPFRDVLRLTFLEGLI